VTISPRNNDDPSALGRKLVRDHDSMSDPLGEDETSSPSGICGAPPSVDRCWRSPCRGSRGILIRDARALLRAAAGPIESDHTRHVGLQPVRQRADPVAPPTAIAAVTCLISGPARDGCRRRSWTGMETWVRSRADAGTAGSLKCVDVLLAMSRSPPWNSDRVSASRVARLPGTGVAG